MARFLHSIALPNTDLAASADIAPFDLPVNPLSMILLRFQITNLDPAVMDVYSAIDDVITQVTNIRVQHKGEDIIQGSLRDLMVLNAVRRWAYPGFGRLAQPNDALRSLVFPLCFGRRPYDPTSCFPATTRGNLRFFLTAGADGAGYDDINISVETVELIEATPSEYEKTTTVSATSAIGQFDVVLPIGNELLGLLLFDTGLSGASDEVLSWGTVKLLKDNVEQYFPLSDFETLAGMLPMQAKNPWALYAGHKHGFIAPGPAADLSDDAHMAVTEGPQGYAYLDFDPLRDHSYVLETAGAADLRLRGSGDEATAVRVLPVERVLVR